MTTATGRVALVTGSSTGIGAATARLLAERGTRVVVNYLRSAQAAEEVVADIEAAGGQAMAVQADVREAAAVDTMIERVRAAWGGVDVLVHNALTPYAIKPFQDMIWDELGGKLEDEIRAAFVVTKAVLPAMTDQGWGRLIYLGTGLSRQPRAGMIALGTAKVALTQFARYLAQELGPQGITVNVVEPGPVAETKQPEADHRLADMHERTHPSYDQPRQIPRRIVHCEPAFRSGPTTVRSEHENDVNSGNHNPHQGPNGPAATTGSDKHGHSAARPVNRSPKVIYRLADTEATDDPRGCSRSDCSCPADWIRTLLIDAGYWTQDNLTPPAPHGLIAPVRTTPCPSSTTTAFRRRKR